MRIALRVWFAGRQTRLFAWFGVAVLMLHKVAGVAMSQVQIEWQGRFYDILGDAPKLGKSGLSKIYPELHVFVLIVAYYVIVPPMISWFKKYYNLCCDQTVQRAYVARWPTSVPEGAAQRVHEDVCSLRDAWQWCMGAVITELGKVVMFVPQLMLISAKFPLPASVFPAPPLVRKYWAPLAALGTPAFATLVSVVIARPMKALNYERQRHDAEVRKALVVAEDTSQHAKPEVGSHLRRLMSVSVTLWQRSAFYDSWTSLYGYVPYALCFLLAAPQLFSDDKGAPTLGDLQKLILYFDAVNTSLSFFAFNMNEVNFFRSVVQRLREFEAAALSGASDVDDGVLPPALDDELGHKHLSDCEEGTSLLRVSSTEQRRTFVGASRV